MYVMKSSMKITLAVPWFKEHDAIGNYVYFTALGLSRKHEIRIVCINCDRTVPGVSIVKKPRIGIKLLADYVSGLGLVLRCAVNIVRVSFLRRNVETLLNLARTLLTHWRRTLPVLLWIPKSFQNSDIVWVHMTRLGTMASAAFISRMFLKTKIVIDYHGITPYESFKTENDRKQSIFAEKIGRIVLPFANKVIVHSQYMKAEVQGKYGATAKVIPLGVSLSHFKQTGHKQILSKYVLSGKHVLVYVGRLVHHKSVDVLINAFALVRKALPNSVVLIIGNGPERRNLETLVSKLDLQDSVHFLGECSDDDLPRFYSAADVFIIPSIHEGFCSPIIEAMACGTPVIGSNCTAIRETMGGCGILFEPNNIRDLAEKILSLLTDERLRRTLAKQGLKYAKSFSWKATTSRLEELFRNV